MSGNNRTLKINPELFKLNGKSKKDKKSKSVRIREKPIIDEENSSKTNKIKRQLMKKIQDRQNNQEKDKIKKEKENNNLNDKNLFEKNISENSDFEREFNTSLNFLQDLAKKSKEKRKKNNTIKSNISYADVNIDLPDNLINKNILPDSSIYNSYGCLKNGSKPTFRQLNRTQKMNDNLKPRVKISLENNIYDDNNKFEIKQLHEDQERQIVKPSEMKPSEMKPAEMKPAEMKPSEMKPVEMKPVEMNPVEMNPVEMNPVDVDESSIEFPYSKINKLIYNNEKLELSDKQFMDDIKLDTTVEPLQVKKDTTIASENIPKIKKITRTYTYKLGKIKGKNRIGILIKNRETQKNIKREVSILQQKSLQDIKNHLIDKNLIKAGSYAPNDVLREIYKESILAGEITNINNNNMVYNYLNE